MTKYLIYADGERKPIRKFKREYEAIEFASDFRNLADYGCMTVVRHQDDGSEDSWNMQNATWENVESNG